MEVARATAAGSVDRLRTTRPTASGYRVPPFGRVVLSCAQNHHRLAESPSLRQRSGHSERLFEEHGLDGLNVDVGRQYGVNGCARGRMTADTRCKSSYDLEITAAVESGCGRSVCD